MDQSEQGLLFVLGFILSTTDFLNQKTSTKAKTKIKKNVFTINKYMYCAYTTKKSKSNTAVVLFKVPLAYLTHRSCLCPCYETSSIYPVKYHQQTALKLHSSEQRDCDFRGYDHNTRRPAVQNLVREN